MEGLILDIKYHQNHFWILTDSFLYSLEENKKILKKELGGFKFTAFDLNQNEAVIGTNNGFLRFNLKNKNIEGKLNRKIPVLNITAVKIIGNKIWFGSANGAFALNSHQTIDYYQGKRWLCGNSIVKIEKGPQNSVLILSENGLSQIQFDDWTLAKKAEFYQNQVRQRHIRHGFNATLAGMKEGNLAMGYLDDADNDGLWTAMYLGAEVFKYAVTKDSFTLENIAEALEAMERLYTINPLPGFPARSFERAGYISQLHDPERWQHAPDPAWDWKATTSSDEAIGHIFAYGVLAELVEDPKLKSKAITLIDTLMNHILKNDFYLIDYDGKPTLWGKWHPDYVNGFEKNIGDRKLNSSNIIAMLQTAYYFTKKPIYKEKALYLLQEKGYFENLMRPFSEIGEAPTDADDKSKLLSDAWNHSDDEMYFLGYWGLYNYALNDTLKNHFKAAIIDHWQIERPEKEGLWNIFTAITGTPNFDLEEAVWYLKEHPLDMIDWNIANSHRKDLNFIKPNFRNQRLDKVLPPDERAIQRHNANMFDLDRSKGEGNSEHSAGDIWLLPYWMGRYLGVISN
jgi:hypothetical protein